MFRLDFFAVGQGSQRWTTNVSKFPTDEDLLLQVRARGIGVDEIEWSIVSKSGGQLRRDRRVIGTFAVRPLDAAAPAQFMGRQS